MKRILALFIIFVLIFNTPVYTGTSAFAQDKSGSEAEAKADMERGIALLQEGKDKEAFLAIKKAAEAEYAPAMGKLAYMYWCNIGVDASFLSDLFITKWAKKGTLLNDPESILVLGLYNNKDNYQEAFKNFEQLAELNDPIYRGYAFCWLGNIYTNRFAEPEIEKVLKYYQQSAAEGFTCALSCLGYQYSNKEEIRDYKKALDYYTEFLNSCMPDISPEEYFVLSREYENMVSYYKDNTLSWMGNIGYDLETSRNNTKIDYALALKYYETAAAHEFPRAMVNLGYMYAHGKGVKQDYTKAMELYLKAADLGDAEGFAKVGIAYDNGNGTEQNYEKALEMYLKAADLGSSEGAHNAGVFYYTGKGTAQNYEKALEMFLKAADLGSSECASIAGDMYFNGKGTDRDYNKAMEMYLKAADLGDADGALTAASLYYYGSDGISKDHAKALEMFLKAADLGNAEGALSAGVIYLEESENSPDYAKALEMFLKAADLGSAEGANNAGLIYSGKYGTNPDYAKALEMFLKAADLGDELGAYNAGIAFEKGDGTGQSYEKALEMFKLSAELGYENAKEKIRSYEAEGKGISN